MVFIILTYFLNIFLVFIVVFHYSNTHRNFHVWNEMWTKRKDLSTENYDGWQVVDCTPQETSFSLHQLGPAPLKAIRNGDLYIQYDVGFVFAEVNADYVKWIVSKDASGNVVFKGKYSICATLSTTLSLVKPPLPKTSRNHAYCGFMEIR